MVYTTHLWWLGGWFIIAIPTLESWNQQKTPTFWLEISFPNTKIQRSAYFEESRDFDGNNDDLL